MSRQCIKHQFEHGSEVFKPFGKHAKAANCMEKQRTKKISCNHSRKMLIYTCSIGGAFIQRIQC